MNDDQILAEARKDPNRGREYDNKVLNHSSLLGTFIALLVGTGLCLLEYSLKKTVNIGLIAVGMTAVGVQYLYSGIKLRKPLTIAAGSVAAILAVVFILAYIIRVAV